MPVTMIDMRPMVRATINGTEALFIADSGAFYSMMSVAGATQFRLKTFPAPWGLRVSGMGGEAGGLSEVMVKDFTLAGVPVPIHHIEFLVGGGDVGGGSVGVLGQNVFQLGDVEYDLANGVIRLMREDGCGKSNNLAYWIAGTSQAFTVMDIEPTTPLSPHTTGTAIINGVKMHVMFDTGAYASMLSLHAALRAGVKVEDQGVTLPGVVEAGFSRGVGRGTVKTWIAPVASFKLGDEEISHTKLRIGDMAMPSVDMLIGVDFFLSHRLYVASKEHRLFFTYNGGPVFDLSVSTSSAQTAVPGGEPAPGAAAGGAAAAEASAGKAALGANAAGAAAAEASAGKAAPGANAAGAAAGDASAGKAALGANAAGAAGAAGAAAAGTQEDSKAAAVADSAHDAADFSRRGSAFAARRDFAHAIVDLTRACELAPDQPDYFYQRGVVRRESHQNQLAMADFDQAIRLNPDHVPALVVRAELRLSELEAANALQDLDAADRVAAKEADARFEMAFAYARVDSLPQAVVQLNLWIAAHRDDARLPQALDERCWAKALVGQDLAGALDDCNTALARNGKEPAAAVAEILKNRGLVQLRRGEYDKSVRDFTDSLSRLAKNPWALYGRGIDEMRQGKTAQGRADMAFATTIWSPIADEFNKHGMTP